MAKKALVFMVLLLLLNSLDILAESQINNDLNEIISASEELEKSDKPPSSVRGRRLADPVNGIFGFFTTLGSIKRIFNDQYNETTYSLSRVLDLLADGFTDTATKKPYTKPPITTTTTTEASSENNGNTTETTTTTTTTEKYRISRKELGYILGRNYRGLRKLFNIELNDALNQSQYSIKNYKNELGASLSQYTIPKELPPTTTTEADN